MMKTKSIKGAILISNKSFIWLNKMLKKNEKRTVLTKKEEELAKGMREFDKSIIAIINES